MSVMVFGARSYCEDDSWRTVQGPPVRSLTLICTFMLFFIWSAAAVALDSRILHIYLDADRTNHFESARSIEMGVRTAFDEIGNEVQGYEVEFVPVDHRGNAVRSKKNMERFRDDPDALLMLAGMHSPPLIEYRDFINNQQILTLVPWAAGGPITRHTSTENWIFRLSLDDTKAGRRLAEFAVNDLACVRPRLLLERTAWGRSNEKAMSRAIGALGRPAPKVAWFDWGMTAASARIMVRDIVKTGSDCILMVSNSVEGALFAQAMAFQDGADRIPIISHWGITGGKFHETINSRLRENLDLYFVQTCFSFVSSTSTPTSANALKRAMALFPDDIRSAKDMRAPAGFIHAYDLGLILRAALREVTLKGRAGSHREELRSVLQSLRQPIQGLVRTYDPPFRPYHPDRPDAHEALGLDDLCMATYGPDDEILIYEGRSS